MQTVRKFDMTYEQFKKQNDESKKFFAQLGRVYNVRNAVGICDFSFNGNITKAMPIMVLISNIIYDGMGAISNPSALKNWNGWKQ